MLGFCLAWVMLGGHLGRLSVGSTVQLLAFKGGSIFSCDFCRWLGGLPFLFLFGCCSLRLSASSKDLLMGIAVYLAFVLGLWLRHIQVWRV